MATKTKRSRNKLYRSESRTDNVHVGQDAQKSSQSKPTVLGLTPERIGVVVASAVIGEVLQVAMNKVSQSDLPELKQVVQKQLDSIGHPMKGVVGAVKDAIADIASPAQEAVDRATGRLEDGQAATVETVNQGLGFAKETTSAARDRAKNETSSLLDGTLSAADNIRQLIADRGSDVITGTQRTTEATRHALGDTVGSVKNTANATQQAVAAVVEEAVDRVRAILMNDKDTDSTTVTTVKTKDTKSKKGKKGKKGKKNKNKKAKK